MEEELAFLRAIADAPEDDAPRLIFADWLDEHGAADRAELIRVQCAMARLSSGDPGRAELLEKIWSLLDRCRSVWAKPLMALGVTSVELSRGIPVAANMAFDSFLENGGTLFERMPSLTEMNLPALRFGDEGARALATSSHLSHLTRLGLARNDIGDGGAGALAGSLHLSHLTRLDLWNNRIGDEGARALATSSHLSHLTRLNLGRNDVGEAGARALATSSHLSHLTRLNLGNNGIGSAGLQALAASTTFQPGMHIVAGAFSGSFEEFRRWECEQRLGNRGRWGGREPG